MLKQDRCKCEWKPTTKYATKYIRLVSCLHIHTKYLDLQACKKLSHGGVKAFDDYMCTSVNVKKWISYIVNENNKICYTVQHIKVQDLYIFTMLHVYVHSMYLLVTCWNSGILNIIYIYYIHVQTSCFDGSIFLRDNALKNKSFSLPTDPTQKFRVGKGQTKYFLI